jgi:hypothetical protein
LLNGYLPPSADASAATECGSRTRNWMTEKPDTIAERGKLSTLLPSRHALRGIAGAPRHQPAQPHAS